MNTEEFKEVEKEVKLETKRGSLLSILCILTFVGAGIEIISAIFSFATIDTHLKDLQSTFDFLNASGGDEISVHLKNSVAKEIDILGSWGKIGFIGKVIGASICFLGAWLMRNLKKKGFYLYIVGQVVSLIVTFLILQGVGGLFASYWIAWILFPLIFTGLYALQLNKMR